jgi:hypothetical protein
MPSLCARCGTGACGRRGRAIDGDGAWRWDDEHELEAAVDAGLISPEEAHEARAEGERVLADWPFPTGWEDWRPDPEWPLPKLAPGWDRVS